MEVPVINRINNFAGGVPTCLQNPSFPSQILSFSGQDELFRALSFWKWGAFIIAMIASFGTIISRVRILVIQLQCRFCKSSASEPLLRNSDDDLDYSDGDDDGDDDADDAVSCSSFSSVSDFEEDDVMVGSADEDFQVKGSGLYNGSGLRRSRSSGDYRRFSWSDFSTGKSVVELWEGLGLGFDDGDHTGREVSDYASAAAAALSPATILSAGTSESGLVSLGVWDTRVGCRIPAVIAEWGPQLGRIVGVASDGAGKVYVRDGVSGVTVGDLRNVGSPLNSLTAYGLQESGADSGVTRCCHAVRSYLL